MRGCRRSATAARLVFGNLSVFVAKVNANAKAVQTSLNLFFLHLQPIKAVILKDMKMLVSVPAVTNRLRYVFEIILSDQLGIDYSFTTDRDEFDSYSGPKLCYGGTAVGDALYQRSVSLLFEHDVREQNVKHIDFLDVKGLFPVYSEESVMPFDVFAASFYLVTRYEEYLPNVRDGHDRFMAESGIMYKIGMLRKPLVNIWAAELGCRIAARYPEIRIHKKHHFAIIPTYDIDMAWSYRHKGIGRTVVGFMRDAVHGDWNMVSQRGRVLLGKENDPFDTYDYQLDLQKDYGLKPVYFVLCGPNGPYDKNQNIYNTPFRNLIKRLSDYAEVGIHPSYGSYLDGEAVRSEIDDLSDALNKSITQSRQHFLRLNLPESYNILIKNDITDDYTMGFASQPGFRAGYSDRFKFFNVELNITTKLVVHPFAFMDGTLCDYMKLRPDEAAEVIRELISEVKAVEGEFVMLWHNESLSNQARWKGWRSVYESIFADNLKRQR